jgi:DnaJ-class molecular chaperone
MAGERCQKCNGAKTIIVQTGAIAFECDCDECAGTGVVNDPNACKECKGSGNVIRDMCGMKFECRCDQCNGSGKAPLAKST